MARSIRKQGKSQKVSRSKKQKRASKRLRPGGAKAAMGGTKERRMGPRKGRPVSASSKSFKQARKGVLEQQRSTAPVIPYARFARLVKEITNDVEKNDTVRMQASAIEMLQEATEMYVIRTFEIASKIVARCGRKTLSEKDLGVVTGYCYDDRH